MSKTKSLTITDKLKLEQRGRVFEYQLCDAFGSPRTDVCVRRVDGQPQVKFVDKDAFWRILRDQAIVINIDEQTFAQISSILNRNDKIFSLDHRLKDDFCGLDGCEHKFYFNDGEREIELSGHCLDTVFNKRTSFPDENLVIDVLYSIRDILMPLGVSENCFRLQ